MQANMPWKNKTRMMTQKRKGVTCSVLLFHVQKSSLFFTRAAQWLVSLQADGTLRAHFSHSAATGWQRCWGSCRGGRRVQLARTLAGHREWRRQAGKARSLGSLLAAVWLGCRWQLICHGNIHLSDRFLPAPSVAKRFDDFSAKKN